MHGIFLCQTWQEGTPVTLIGKIGSWRVDEIRRQRFDDEIIRGKSLGLDLLEIDFANPLETKMHMLWTKDVAQQHQMDHLFFQVFQKMPWKTLTWFFQINAGKTHGKV